MNIGFETTILVLVVFGAVGCSAAPQGLGGLDGGMDSDVPADAGSVLDSGSSGSDGTVSEDASAVRAVPWVCPDRTSSQSIRRVVCADVCSSERGTLYVCVAGGTAAPRCYKEPATGNLYVSSMGV
jgi:hypothetical protein